MLINLLFLVTVIFSFDLRSQTLENQFSSPVHVLANIKKKKILLLTMTHLIQNG